MWNWTFELHFSSVHVRPEHGASGSPPGSRPAEDGAGCHAAGGAGSDVTVNLPLLTHRLSFTGRVSGVGSYHTNIWSATAFEHFCESDGPPQTSQSVPPTVGLNSQSLWGVSLQYLDFKYSMFLMPLSVLYIYMGNCLPVSTSSCFKLAYNRTSVVTQARSQVSELMVPTATQMIWTQWSVDGGSQWNIFWEMCTFAFLPFIRSEDLYISTLSTANKGVGHARISSAPRLETRISTNTLHPKSPKSDAKK